MALPVLLQAGLPALIKGLAEGLKAVNTPVAQGASTALDALIDAFGQGKMTKEEMEAVNTHIEKMAALEADERKNAIAEVNESLRVEVASTDPYVRRMRPTFGYIIALTWAAQMFALAYVIVFETAQAALVIEAVQSLGTIWAVGLSVLGIYVYKRSEEKRVDSGLSFPQSSTPATPAKPRGYNS